MRSRKKMIILFSTLSLALSLAGCKKPVVEKPPEEQVEVTDKSFRCLHQMKKANGVYLDNLLGNLEGTLAVNNSAAGGVYPPGSVIQLIPSEAMVKREKGANPATNDWEFFTLDVAADGAKVTQRGFDPEKPVKNMFGTCVSCHKQAAPERDMVCGKGHGCPPVVFPGGINNEVLTSALQKTDKRCASPEPLTPEETAELKKLQAIIAVPAASSHTGTR